MEQLPDQMKESPNHLEPLKTNKTSDHPIPDEAHNKKPGTENKIAIDADKDADNKDEPIPGEPVLGSDRGPWEGTD